MAIGLSLHVGIDRVDSDIFPNASALMGPENDAVAMRDLATNHGFTTEILTGSNATYDAVTAKLQNAAQVLSFGDIFLFTFAGHGTAMIDTDGDESDNQDEAVLLFDRMLFDDDLRLNIWPTFRQGVRVLMVADCCHSGTVLARFVPSTLTERVATVVSGIALDTSYMKTNGVQRRKISNETRRKHLEKFREFYEAIRVPLLAPAITASILLLAACGDDQTAADGPNGAFTAALLKVLQNDNPVDYQDLITKVTTELASTSQTPVLTPGDPPNQAFISQGPFTI
jgi:caspase domain-containing protein